MINKIEGFDISHLQEKKKTASCVPITKDGPDKKNYRIIILKKVLIMIIYFGRAVQRRCKNLQKNNWIFRISY